MVAARAVGMAVMAIVGMKLVMAMRVVAGTMAIRVGLHRRNLLVVGEASIAAPRPGSKPHCGAPPEFPLTTGDHSISRGETETAGLRSAERTHEY